MIFKGPECALEQEIESASVATKPNPLSQVSAMAHCWFFFLFASHVNGKVAKLLLFPP